MDAAQQPSPPTVEQPPPQRLVPVHNLPPITSIKALTEGHASGELSPLPHHSISSDPRDSGNWSQSKRKLLNVADFMADRADSSGISASGFGLQSILNADSPSRNSIPDHPLKGIHVSWASAIVLANSRSQHFRA
jgi:hypothetical protein